MVASRVSFFFNPQTRVGSEIPLMAFGSLASVKFSKCPRRRSWSWLLYADCVCPTLGVMGGEPWKDSDEWWRWASVRRQLRSVCSPNVVKRSTPATSFISFVILFCFCAESCNHSCGHIFFAMNWTFIVQVSRKWVIPCFAVGKVPSSDLERSFQIRFDRSGFIFPVQRQKLRYFQAVEQ